MRAYANEPNRAPEDRGDGEREVAPGPMTEDRLHEIPVGAQPLERFEAIVGEQRMIEARARAERLRERLAGRVLWNVNSTAAGGGVAEILRSLLTYPRGLGIDTRWLVIHGTPEFFHLTKRIHHAIHGSVGDGTPLGEEQRAIYDQVLHENAEELLTLVRPRDVVILHDPQTAGLVPYLARADTTVIWRCHVGQEVPDEQTRLAWDFLAPYLQEAHATVFSHHAYVPDCCNEGRAVTIHPSIDPFSPKNQAMDDDTVRAILVHTGFIEGPSGGGSPTFLREDGSPGRVDRHADIVRSGRAPKWETPLVVQVSRWDPLKDPVGVLQGFADVVNGSAPADAELVLAGPNVESIPDDPEQADVLNQVMLAWRALSHSDRNRIHLASLPMADVEENAAIVNALQRHAAIIVQKSIHEGFGLTVTEAMWKGRPIVASKVGGITEQINDGVEGLLLRDPTDAVEFGAALRRLLEHPDEAARLGAAAKKRAGEEFIGFRHLLDYADLLEQLDA